MAIGSHGTGRGGTVGDDRTGRSAELGKALSFSSLFGAASVATDLLPAGIWTEAPPAVDCWMAVRSSTTCGYTSDAISITVRYCIVVFCPTPKYSEPESVRARELIIDQHAFASGTESSGPCRLWSIV